MTDSAAPAHERYVYKPFPGSSHFWAEGQFAQLGPETKVLDIGVGSGAMGKSLQDRGIKQIFGIEIDPQAKAFAAPHYQEICDSITAYADQHFDLILMLDVLEHMTAPEEFLSQAVALLNPGGRVLISLPNIAHWSMRLSLLFGFFEYTNRGILDRTHFQFFNRRRVHKLIAATKVLEIKEFAVSIEPAELVLPKSIGASNWFKNLATWRSNIAQFLPGLLGYQHLISAVKVK